MYISLSTLEVWQINGDVSAGSFFESVGKLLNESDTLVLGIYDSSDEIQDYLALAGTDLEGQNDFPFKDTFDMNRDEYPRGSAHLISPSNSILTKLAEFARKPKGGKDSDVFVDHILAYRIGVPMLPLFNFHDAFSGGIMYVSGMYSNEEISTFTEATGESFCRVDNPELLS